GSGTPSLRRRSPRKHPAVPQVFHHQPAGEPYRSPRTVAVDPMLSLGEQGGRIISPAVSPALFLIGARLTHPNLRATPCGRGSPRSSLAGGRKRGGRAIAGPVRGAAVSVVRPRLQAARGVAGCGGSAGAVGACPGRLGLGEAHGDG